MMQIAFVVPTKDRPAELARMLSSLAAQTRKPDQIVVVDGSDPPIEDVCNAVAGLAIDYVREFPPSLARQRNAGMRRVGAGMTLAGYLDDDVVLERDAVEKMLEFWSCRSTPEVGGAVFNIVNNPVPGRMWLKRLFLIDHPRPGRVLASGFPSSFSVHDHDLEVDWVNGGATVWRRNVIEAFPYDEWFVGTGFMEDVDYSFTVRGKYRLALVAAARLAHYSAPIRPDRNYLLGRWQVVNRFYFVRKNLERGLGLPAAWWASVGLVLLNTVAGVLKRDRGYIARARGNLAGMLAELAGRRERVGGYLK